MIDTILNLVFPADCVVCGARVTEWRSGALCSPCAGGLQRISPPICRRCGRPQPRIVGEGGHPDEPQCYACQTGETRFDFGRSALVFDETLRRAIHHFKYSDRVSLARPFARRLVDCLDQHPFTANRVIPVPLHKKRERQRGYNQASLLASRLGLEVQTGVVRRHRPTAAQTGLGRVQRAANVRGAFECHDAVEGSYLLLDDVMTTGATVNEVARVLRKKGASRIEVLTLTRATMDPGG